MAFINIFAFIALALLLSLRFDEQLVLVLPLNLACWILILYFLALLRSLALIDSISVAVIALCLFIFFRRFGKAFFKEIYHRVFSPSAVSLYIVLLLAFLVSKDLLIRSSDDLHCWALEVKSIFYYGGFAPRDSHAAVLFGDYLPGTTLFRWWVCHLLPGFEEGLINVGSTWLFVFILAPFFSLIGGSIAVAIISGVFCYGFLLILPGVIDFMSYTSNCAEPAMAASIASSLYALFSARGRLKLPLLTSCLFFLFFFKSSGIAFALAFILLTLLIKRAEKSLQPSQRCISFNIPTLMKLSGLCALPTLSWFIFCRLMNRSAYFNISFAESTGETLATGPMAYLKSLVTGFFAYPAHFVNDGIIDLSPFAILLILLLLYYCANRLGYLSVPVSRVLIRFLFFSVITILFVLFFMHSFVFREPQYLSADSCCISFSRYSLPITLGFLMFAIYLFIAGRRGKTRLLSIVFAAGFAIICTCPWTVFYRSVNYANSNNSALENRAYISDICGDFLSQLDSLRPAEGSSRYLFIHKENALSGSDQALLSFMSAPDSIVFCELGESTQLRAQNDEVIYRLAENNKIDFIYFLDPANHETMTGSAISQSVQGAFYSIPSAK